MIRKPRPKKLEQISGWFEVLLRFAPLKRLKSLHDLDPDDYMMIGQPIPLNKFEGTYQAYMTLQGNTGNPDLEGIEGATGIALPRPIREYDIFNMVYRHRGDSVVRVTNLLMIDDSGDKNLHLIHDGARLQWQKGYELTQLPLQGTYIGSKRQK